MWCARRGYARLVTTVIIAYTYDILEKKAEKTGVCVVANTSYNIIIDMWGNIIVTIL